MSRGSKPGERRGGRQAGTPNKKTLKRLEREQIAEQVTAALHAEAEVIAARKTNRSLGKDVMEDFLPILAGMAAYYQPTFPGMPQQNQNGDPAEFERWFRLTLDLASSVAKYQSPTFKAIQVHVPAEPQQQVSPPAGSNVIPINDPIALERVYRRMINKPDAA